MEGKGDARTQDDTMDIIMEAEVDKIVEMINNILISNSTDAMVDHALRFLENKKAQMGDKWTLQCTAG